MPSGKNTRELTVFDAIAEATKDIVSNCCKADEILVTSGGTIVGSECAACGKKTNYVATSVWGAKPIAHT